jgi:hypothetical protein
MSEIKCSEYAVSYIQYEIVDKHCYSGKTYSWPADKIVTLWLIRYYHYSMCLENINCSVEQRIVNAHAYMLFKYAVVHFIIM